MDHVYLDDEALEASDLSCLVTSPRCNSEASIMGFSESVALTPKSSFLHKVKTLLGKKPGDKSPKTLLQQIQSGQSDDLQGLSSAYRKTTRVWAFKIIPLKEPNKKQY